jgi:predicted small integral membrane protein
VACAALNNPLISTYWDFGDPASGVNNISYAYLGSHYYSAPGTYTTKLALNYSCYSDTVRQVITISTPNPSFSVLSPSAICRGDRVVFTASASAAYNYTWSGGVQGNTLAVTPSVSTSYTVKATNTVTGCSSTKTINLSVNKCLGIINSQDMMADVSVYPNPSNGLLIVETTRQLNVSIYNQLATLVFSTVTNQTNNNFDLSQLPQGVYYIKVYDGEKVKVLKWLKGSD